VSQPTLCVLKGEARERTERLMCLKGDSEWYGEMEDGNKSKYRMILNYCRSFRGL
jgi:hypothetical protein